VGTVGTKKGTAEHYLEFLANTRKLLAVIDEKVDLLEADGTSHRNRISAALFDITHDHAKAIVLSLEHSLYASAYALDRPLMECFVRGAWILHCASDDQIQLIKEKDKFNLSLSEMLVAVEKCKDWPETLSLFLKKCLKALHSFTHGGLQIIARRMKDEYIEQDVDEVELIGMLQLVCIVSFLSLNEMIGMSKRHGQEDAFLSGLLDELCGWCFTDLAL